MGNKMMLLGWTPEQWAVAVRAWRKTNRFSIFPDTPVGEYDYYAQAIAGVQSMKRAWRVHRAWRVQHVKDPNPAEIHFE